MALRQSTPCSHELLKTRPPRGLPVEGPQLSEGPLCTRLGGSRPAPARASRSPGCPDGELPDALPGAFVVFPPFTPAPERGGRGGGEGRVERGHGGPLPQP